MSADELVGYDMIQYGALDTGKNLDGSSSAHPVAVSGFKSADITKMCQSVVTPNIPVLGSVTLKLEAGADPNHPVHAENIYIDISDLKADATFSDLDIGVAAGDSSNATQMNPGDVSGKKANPYGFAQRASKAVLTGVQQTAWATTAGTFSLSGLHMSLSTGSNECY